MDTRKTERVGVTTLDTWFEEPDCDPEIIRPAKPKRRKRKRRKAHACPTPVSAPEPAPVQELVDTRECVEQVERAERAERALSQYWRLLDALLSIAPDMFSLKNRFGVYQAASASFCSFVGRAEKDIRGRTDTEIVPAACAALFARHDEEVMRTRTARVWEESLRLRDRTLLLRVSKSPVSGESGECAGILCCIRDVSALHRLTQQNRSLTRAVTDPFWVMDRAGVIVDANQSFLRIIGVPAQQVLGRKIQELGAVEFSRSESALLHLVARDGAAHCSMRLKVGEQSRQFDIEATEVSRKSGRIICFAGEVKLPPARVPDKPAAGQPRSLVRARLVDLNDLVRRALAPQDRQIPSSVQVSCDLEPNLWRVLADPLLVLQVFSNLVANAVEAMDGRGKLRVCTRNIQLVEELALMYPQLKPGRYSYASIEDSGRGITPSLVAKIFDPFITTKQNGRGMGLANARRNVQMHHGHITVRSQPGQGTSFSVFLPAYEGKAPENGSAALPVGTETLLVVEGENAMLAHVTAMLQKLAYRVLGAISLHQAFDLLQRPHAEIGAMLLDSAVPDLDPAALMARLKRLHPDVKIIVTGRGEPGSLELDLLDAGATAYIRKPYRVELLAPKLREVLDR